MSEKRNKLLGLYNYLNYLTRSIDEFQFMLAIKKNMNLESHDDFRYSVLWDCDSRKEDEWEVLSSFYKGMLAIREKQAAEILSEIEKLEGEK